MEINDTINTVSLSKLQVLPVAKTSDLEILCISLERHSIFPEHISPRDTQLVVLEGEISFFINNKQFDLLKHQHLSFPKEVVHWVKANENSKFLIIR